MDFFTLDRVENDLVFEDCFTLFHVNEVNAIKEGLFYNHVNKYWIMRNNHIIRKRVGSFLCHTDFRVLKLQMEDAPKLFKDCEIKLIPFIFLKRHS